MRYIFWGENYYIAISSPICQRGKTGYKDIFPGGGVEIYYITIFQPIQVRGKNEYIAIFPGGGGGKWR